MPQPFKNNLPLFCFFISKEATFQLELYFKCQQSFVEQVSHFSNGEMCHLGIKHFLYVFIAENEFGASELHH